MEKKLHKFLASDILEKYVIGEASTEESITAEHYIDTYPEISQAYEKLQDNLEILAKFNAIEAPKGIFDKIETGISEQVKVIPLKSSKRRTPWFGIAASIAALIFAGTSFSLFQKNQKLNSENSVVVEEIFDLRKDIENNNSKLNDLADQLAKLNNPDSKKYVLTGNNRAKDLKTVAYINPVEKTSMIDVITLPKLPEEQYYQIWAEFQDKMVNLGILDASERKLRPIPYMEDAVALSITIEGKSESNSREQKQVAEISLKNKK